MMGSMDETAAQAEVARLHHWLAFAEQHAEQSARPMLHAFRYLAAPSPLTPAQIERGLQIEQELDRVAA